MVILSYTGRFNQWLLTLCFTLFACDIQAEALADNLDIRLKTEIPTLVASPALCELQKGQTACQMDVTLLWETPRAGHYCLWASEQDSPLACWQNSWSGSYGLPFASAKQLSFWLTLGVEGGIVASTTISVTRALEQRMRAKRRRGFWRVF